MLINYTFLNKSSAKTGIQSISKNSINCRNITVGEMELNRNIMPSHKTYQMHPLSWSSSSSSSYTFPSRKKRMQKEIKWIEANKKMQRATATTKTAERYFILPPNAVRHFLLHSGAPSAPSFSPIFVDCIDLDSIVKTSLFIL